MAKSRLSWSAAAAVMVGGGLVEVVSSPSVPLGLLDWFVGAGFVAGAVLLPDRLRLGTRLLGWLTAVLWFLATLATTPQGGWPAGWWPAGWWQAVAGPIALGYRAPLLHQLVGPTLRLWRHRTAVLACAYLAALLVTGWAGLATAAMAGALSAIVSRGVTAHGLPGPRRTDRPTGVLLGAMAVIWAASAASRITGPEAIVACDGVALLASWQVWRRRSLWPTVADLAVELGQDARPAAPVVASLAAVLADPELRIALDRADDDWRDESGQPIAAPDPDSDRVTVVVIPGGGRLALLHGRAGAGDSDLARSAARAAALVLDSVRLTAEAQRRTADVKASGARLVTVEDEERTALAERIAIGPQRTLASARGLIESCHQPAGLIAPILDQLDQLDVDLGRLAQGLHPSAIADGALTDALLALRALNAGSGLPTTLELSGPLDDLPPPTRALVYFVTAECLTNITRHAQATAATVCVTCADALRITVDDDGSGGAVRSAGGGLQGIADRLTVAGGSFAITSPPGGPTTIVAELTL